MHRSRGTQYKPLESAQRHLSTLQFSWYVQEAVIGALEGKFRELGSSHVCTCAGTAMRPARREAHHEHEHVLVNSEEEGCGALADVGLDVRDLVENLHDTAVLAGLSWRSHQGHCTMCR